MKRTSDFGQDDTSTSQGSKGKESPSEFRPQAALKFPNRGHRHRAISSNDAPRRASFAGAGSLRHRPRTTSDGDSSAGSHHSLDHPWGAQSSPHDNTYYHSTRNSLDHNNPPASSSVSGSSSIPAPDDSSRPFFQHLSPVSNASTPLHLSPPHSSASFLRVESNNRAVIETTRQTFGTRGTSRPAPGHHCQAIQESISHQSNGVHDTQQSPMAQGGWTFVGAEEPDPHLRSKRKDEPDDKTRKEALIEVHGSCFCCQERKVQCNASDTCDQCSRRGEECVRVCNWCWKKRYKCDPGASCVQCQVLNRECKRPFATSKNVPPSLVVNQHNLEVGSRGIDRGVEAPTSWGVAFSVNVDSPSSTSAASTPPQLPSSSQPYSQQRTNDTTLPTDFLDDTTSSDNVYGEVSERPNIPLVEEDSLSEVTEASSYFVDAFSVTHEEWTTTRSQDDEFQ